MTQRILRAAEIVPPELHEARRPKLAKPKTRRKAKPAAKSNRGTRPVETFTNGSIETSVWLNPPQNPLGVVAEWKVSQRRIVPTATGPVYSQSLRACDLDDARWGLYQARRFVKRAAKRSPLRSFFLR